MVPHGEGLSGASKVRRGILTPMKIWCNADLSPKAIEVLRAGVAPDELVLSDQRTGNLGAAVAGAEFFEADIAFGQPDPAQAIASENLQWVHLTSAGYTRYDNDEVRAAFQARGAQMTNSSSVYDEPCAQHVLAFMLALARQLPGCWADQSGPRSWSYAEHRPKTRILQGDTVLILGYGAIGKRLAELLAPFGLNVVAVRRTVRGDEGVRTHPLASLPDLLPQADHIVNVLPANPSTDGLVSREFLALAKAGAWFYNVGRGTSVDQSALADALSSGHLGAAYLDVTDPEPLPADHPLWDAPNCHITPHIAGGRQEEEMVLVRHFLENLERRRRGEELADRIL